jgi:hypothetical protein
MRPFTSISVVLLALIAIGHLLRVPAGWEIIVNGILIPMWPSVLVFLVFGLLALMLRREAGQVGTAASETETVHTEGGES